MLRTVNTITLGLFSGYFLGQVLVSILSVIFEMNGAAALPIIKTSLFLLGVFFGLFAVLRTSNAFQICIPFVRLTETKNTFQAPMQAGEQIKIQIQRPGKEPGQGVGYIDDRTMVVVNGGGDRIGKVIDAQVLSIKPTISGKIVFCNALACQSSGDIEQ